LAGNTVDLCEAKSAHTFSVIGLQVTPEETVALWLLITVEKGEMDDVGGMKDELSSLSQDRRVVIYANIETTVS